MELLIGFGFGIILLFLALSLALSFLAGPLAVLKKAGAVRWGRWAIRSVWRALSYLRWLLFRGRRRRGRWPHGQSPRRHF